MAFQPLDFMRYLPSFRKVIPHSRVDYSRVTHPVATLLMDCSTFSYDLHVLGTPPALILSQDQTLVCNLLVCRQVEGRPTIAVSARKGNVMASPSSEGR